MNLYTVSFYRSSPFIRIAIPFIAGMLMQMELSIPVHCSWLSLAAAITIIISLSLTKLNVQYKYSLLRGVVINLAIAVCGSLLLTYLDPANASQSLVNNYRDHSQIVLVLQDPLSEKVASYKTTASAHLVFDDNKASKYTGTILVYFEKTPANQKLKYGDVIITKALLQPVKYSGNPAAFDYRKYCYLQRIHYQVYLRDSDYLLTDVTRRHVVKSFIISVRETIVSILDKHIHGPKEAGLAEALLIGYKDNLDKDLIQSYSNTGVVHVIAISGLHLGLIYAILVMLIRFVSNRWLRLFIVLSGIWLFTLLAGASPSVVRSAVMFSCIAFGNALSRQASVYNSLAASCFMLLSYDPFWLWDTGFQLSYAAVLSIIIFQKPMYQLLNISNKLLDILWKTCAITLAAQILTTPVCMYYFHQFPNLFLAANLVAIPLSSAILILEIVLCCISFFPVPASLMGEFIGWLIRLMNTYIAMIDGHSFANWTSLQITSLQLAFLYIIIAGLAYWLLEGKRRALHTALYAATFFFLLRTMSFFKHAAQHQLVVYNVPRMSAIEIMQGRNAWFLADSALLNNKSQIQFHIKPARIYYRVAGVNPLTRHNNETLVYGAASKSVLIAGSPVLLTKAPDVLIITGSPPGSISTLIRGKLPKVVVFDSSNPQWKVTTWIAQCLELGLPAFSVQHQGAFVMNLN